jgi:membrane protease YdiL (CAAX protease family)
MNLPADPRLLASLLLAALLEEVIFRAGLQEALLRRMQALTPAPRWLGLSAANLLTALLFAAAHAWLRSLWLGLASLAPALLLGWLYERRRNVWLCVLLHAAFNTIWWLISAWLPFRLSH